MKKQQQQAETRTIWLYSLFSKRNEIHTKRKERGPPSVSWRHLKMFCFMLQLLRAFIDGATGLHFSLRVETAI